MELRMSSREYGSGEMKASVKDKMRKLLQGGDGWAEWASVITGARCEHSREKDGRYKVSKLEKWQEKKMAEQQWKKWKALGDEVGKGT